jgi:K(+)-stimulated pyrophosphate-energized sodium pump
MLSLEWMIPISIAIAVLVALYLARSVLSHGTGNPAMQQVAQAIREGAGAFLARQYRTIALLAIIVAVGIFAIYAATGKTSYGWHTSVAFLLGAFCSSLAGYIGMALAVRANLRAANGASESLNRALQLAFRGGAVTGLLVVGLSLAGVYGLYLAFGGAQHPEDAPLLIVGYGFGASFVALFAQLGGGIYTKAADVGADLVGKVEAGIPEDDPRNPAVVADLVGDNVGDCAGRGADLFESTAAENIGAMILGIALVPQFGVKGILFPLVARSFGLLASIVGMFFVRTKNDQENPMAALNRGYLVTSILCAVGMWICTRQMLGSAEVNYLYFFGAGVVGIVMSFIFVWITQYYTDYAYSPVRGISKAAQTGPATTIIAGTAVGFECTAIPVVVICAAIWLSYYLGERAMAGGGLYGTAVATMGMLSTCAYILAMDTFGPITDNAGGIAEMSHAPKETRVRTDALDAAGNSTKAITKGYAIGSAALAAFLLFRAYMDEVGNILTTRARALDANAPALTFDNVDLAKPVVFIGAFLGAMLVYFFSAYAIKAVGNAAQYVIQEVRRQFREIPGILEGKGKPDYASCVDIVTRGALRQMVLPGLIAVVAPILTGVILGAEAAAGMLMIGTIGGVILALYLNNSGGAWDNAKKYIELGNYGGKGSEAHKAGVVGDTVGDPFKDTAGPSLHVLIKLLATLTLVLAALFVR